MSLTLPWPDKRMSPNARVDRRQVADVRRKYRIDCAWLAKAARMNFAHLAETGLHLRIVFNPPDNRARDLDNMLASIKSGLDGLADVIGVDDSKWSLTILRGPLVVKGGSVEVSIIDAKGNKIRGNDA
jgi:crossover junction endodeoxyribonuclease RusA